MMEPPLGELDAGFEPQQRARSNTWPLPRPDNFVDIKEEPGLGKCGGPPGCLGAPDASMGAAVAAAAAAAGMQLPGAAAAAAAVAATAAKKNSSRRNAWGNLSYADLITQAITSAPEKRLTLSQIYEWMVQNVPYFKDKGDSNSSAGWKNSIRHNLSLHNRFMRVQNEGTGKSSWWMINPDAKPGKSARRRATSMETSKFEKRRGRVKKKVEALRNGLTAADATPSPSSSVSESLDLFPDSPLPPGGGFQLSPDFRPRASSNASSAGRLSPIPAVLGVEPDWGAPAGHAPPANAYAQGPPGGYGPEQLAGSLAESMKLQHGDAFMQGYGGGGGGGGGGGPGGQGPPTPQQPPPPYQPPPFESQFGSRHPALHAAASPYGLSQCPVHRMQPCSCHLQPQQQQHSPGAGVSPSYPQPEPSPDPLGGQGGGPAPPRAQPPPAPAPPPGYGPRGDSPPATIMGQLMGALNNSTLLDDLNLNIETLHGGFDCNVDEVIKHELSMEGSLDFNFHQHHHHHHHHHHHPQGAPGAPPEHQQQLAQQGGAPYASVATGPSWVH
ncbi:hypothetical protein R5R35_014825 [Gryllus longicercus]|uniref:Forkhead box protein O n=1 Tax=Gryllus longicercus TaxID=2509291 RepID=A0AAN9VVU6_9ORTH